MNKVAIIPGSFRPCTDAHMQMIRHYAGDCELVAVILSDPRNSARKTSTGIPISTETAKNILETAISDSGLGNVMVFVQGESPVRSAMETISGISGKEIVLGIGKKDDPEKRFGFMVKALDGKNGNRILPPEETSFDVPADYSASDLRRNIGDGRYLRDHLPQCLTKDHMDEIVKSLQEECGVGFLRENFVPEGIFREIVEESSDLGIGPSGIFEDERGIVPFEIDDGAIEKAKCSLNAWNMHV